MNGNKKEIHTHIVLF